MSISLQKGQKISLSKEAPGLNNVIIGLGWDAAERHGFLGMKTNTIDCDASVLLLKNGKLSSDSDIVYYGNLNHKSGSVNHCGDNLTGDGDGDDEQIIVDLNRLPVEYDKLVVIVNIYRAHEKKQDFGLIKNAFMRLVNQENGQEVMRYNLSDNYAGSTAMVFGELYRHNDEWKLNAIGQGTTDGSISELARRYR